MQIFGPITLCESTETGAATQRINKSLTVYRGDPNLLTIKMQENTGLCHYVISVLSIRLSRLTRTGNYRIHEFDWLKSILTAV